MPICSKCNVEQPDSNFYTYYHSVQQKLRTRKICTPCMYKYKKEYKLKLKEQKRLLEQLPQIKEITQQEAYIEEIEVLEVKGVTKRCTECNEVLPISFFYNGQSGNPFKNCKQCYIYKIGQGVRNRKIANGGSIRVKTYPGDFADEAQKNQTHQFLKLIGWSYNGTIWYKEGIKKGDGSWDNVKPMPKKVNKRVYPKGTGRKQLSRVYENAHKIVDDIDNNGIKFFDLADIYNCSHTTLRKVYKKYKNETGTD